MSSIHLIRSRKTILINYYTWISPKSKNYKQKGPNELKILDLDAKHVKDSNLNTCKAQR